MEHDGEPWRNRARPMTQDVIAARTGAVLSRVFCGEDTHGEKSLNRATAFWQAQRDQPYLLLAHEVPRADYALSRRTYRVYEVVRASLFWSRYRQRRDLSMRGTGAPAVLQPPVGNDRFVCELLDKSLPCKLYFDLEFSRALNPDVDGDALQDAVLAACRRGFAEQFQDVACTDVVVLDSCKATKFSRHVIVELDHGATQFAGPADVGAFVRRHCLHLTVRGTGQEPQPFADVSVYSGRQPFRLYAAAKYTEPHRLLCAVHATQPWTTWDPDISLLQRSMVTYHARPATRLLRLVSSEVASSSTKPAPSQRTPGVPRPNVRHDDLCHVLSQVPGIAAVEPARFTFKAESAAVFIDTLCRTCPFRGRDHGHCTIYVHVDLPRARWRLRCRHPACARSTERWQQLPCRDAVDAWLSETWRPTVVGTDKAATLLS